MDKSLFTELEKKVFDALVDDEYICEDYENGATWCDMVADAAGITPTSLGGVMASLSKKGIVWTNGESCGFTDLGADLATR